MKIRRTIFFAALLMAGSHAYAQIEGSRAFTFPENNNELIRIQNEGGDPRHAGDVKIAFYGHNAFKITSPKGLTVLFDPWRNDPTGFWGKWYFGEFPAIPVDLVVSTHAHFDHDAVHRLHALMVMERFVGQFKLGDISLMGLADKHQCASPTHSKWDEAAAKLHLETCPPNNALGFDNNIQVLETGGLRVAIWGDNRAMPGPALDKFLHNLDILVLPIDDTGTILTSEEIAQILARYAPKAVIPAHYLVHGLTTDVAGFKTADGWVTRRKDVHRVAGGRMIFNATELLGAHGRVYYFGNSYVK